MALYQTLDLDLDKVVWDVGHQGYPHKLITGVRVNLIHLDNKMVWQVILKEVKVNLTILAQVMQHIYINALGMAMARERKSENYNCVAVIGDGALTGGMALKL